MDNIGRPLVGCAAADAGCWRVLALHRRITQIVMDCLSDSGLLSYAQRRERIELACRNIVGYRVVGFEERASLRGPAAVGRLES